MILQEVSNLNGTIVTFARDEINGYEVCVWEPDGSNRLAMCFSDQREASRQFILAMQASKWPNGVSHRQGASPATSERPAEVPE
jgi:hypothetical protein